MTQVIRSAYIALIALTMIRPAVAADAPAAGGMRQIAVFDPKALGYANCRIPGIVATKAGTLLAYCEARKNKGGDWDPIDLLLRRSTDNGVTWTEPQVLARTTEQNKTYNNPVAIPDRDTGAVHFLYCVDYARCYYMKSDDDGKTFSEAIEITAPAFEPLKKQYNWNVIATGPTHGIQLRGGRLLVPVWLSTGGKSHHPSVVATIYSDDHGKTWRPGEIAIADTKEVPNPNETVAVELSDGRVMLNARNEATNQRRVVVTSADGATGWSKPIPPPG